MQTLIPLMTAALTTASAEQWVAPGYFNVVAGLTVFAIAWMLTAATVRAIDWGATPRHEAA